MEKKTNELTYSYIWNNQVVKTKDKEYQSRLESFTFRFEKDMDLFRPYTEAINQKFGKIKGKAPYYVTFKAINTKKIFNFYIGYVKNAGMDTQDKRLQISPNIPNYNDQQPFYALSFLPTGDDEIIILVEMKDYVKNKIKSKTNNNSSLWVYFDNILTAYFERKLVIQQDHDKKRYIFRKSQKDVMNNVFSSIFGVANLDEEQIEPEKVGELSVNTYERLARNNSLRDEILKRSNYTCELCKKTNTFQDKDNKWYFEAHHIIPFNISNQKSFKVSLDHMSNLVCLCPECHRKVHFSELKEQIQSLEMILNKKPLLKKYYQIKDSKQLMNFYNKEVE
jgi:hypothetical protein